MIVVWSCSPELSGHSLFVPMSLLFMNEESGQVLLFWKVWQGWLSSGYLRNAFCQALSRVKVHLCEVAPELVCYEEDGTIWVFSSVLVHLSSYNKISQTGELINKQKHFFFSILEPESLRSKCQKCPLFQATDFLCTHRAEGTRVSLSLLLWGKAMAPHSSTLASKIPWMEEPGRLQSMGSLRVGHNWVTSLSLFTFMHWRRKWQPTPVFLPGESQGWQSLVGCHLWGRTESDTTEVT